MTVKILAGLAAAVVLTLVGVYAATGNIPGVETVTEYIAPCPSHTSCDGPPVSSCCSAMAASEVSTCAGEGSAVCPADSLGACAGGLGAAASLAPKPSGCCAE